ncbi:hypothetical protein [Sphingomonas sp. CARO-RG-8B-R24-01]|nr:hypothetical protein [Sphingomonas sp. CARO-RG-8B-R24-01]
MLDQTTRTQAWLVDLAAINSEIAAHGLPAPRRAAKRSRRRKPLWEE